MLCNCSFCGARDRLRSCALVDPRRMQRMSDGKSVGSDGGRAVNTKPAHEVVQARCEHVISRAGDGVREGFDHRDGQEEKRSEGGTGGGRRPAPTVFVPARDAYHGRGV